MVFECFPEKLVVWFDVFSSLLVLEDRIIHIKSGEISELFGVFLIFHTRAFGAYGLNVR